MPGDPPIFKSPQHAKEMGDKYFEYCANSDPRVYPTVVGFAVFCKSSRETIAKYRHRDGYGQIMSAIKDRIYDEKYQSAMRGEVPANLVIWDGVNNHNMINTRSDNKNDNKHSGEITLRQMLDDLDSGGLPAK